jgi:hypothetical protein
LVIIAGQVPDHAFVVAMQLVFSTPGVGSGCPGCALPGAGVSQPESSRPMVTVAMIINASKIGRRPAIFNIFLLIRFGFCLFQHCPSNQGKAISKRLIPDTALWP